MTIEYLQALKNNPKRDGWTNEGLSEIEIQTLEQLYNNSNPFPQVLKELLFLAGKYCSYMDFGVMDSQKEMQEDERAELADVYELLYQEDIIL